MLKYVMTAAALKFFSTPPTKRLYRSLGNTLGQKMRVQQGLSSAYLERVKQILEVCERHHAIQDGDRLLEIGTGWLHWESTILRLFYDVEITLFDVWDNRQFGSYKQYFGQLEETIKDGKLDMTPAQRERVQTLLSAILQTSSFDELYSLLGFKYVINQRGTLEQFQDESFALIFSSNVLEHVDKGALPTFIQGFYRLLKPGGYSIHQIDLGDHLAYYDKSVSLKNYLRYSDKVWKRYFGNDVQYFNLVQRPEWLGFYQQAGFTVVEEESIPVDISSIKVDTHYANLNEQDLQCRTLKVVHRKSQENVAGAED